ncbi:septal ring factor EnvC (AmiA/AmiB activator) [Paenibacillus forsythiae]|uniref:Septal ring factor EnvC (AmiA/AmiB activator) n=1 Tax=Paenibacillus forsythiae TaxID=365616 RepID=A0ABU3H8K5_9BACL|nr:hypothetical protein [Paenibacillus forsythiae]MDT3427154.1 septal ring factor EnvC (AmiA/AmiB activator) [Paenibacillus forsythiae]
MKSKFLPSLPRLLSSILLTGMLYTLPAPAAHANIFNDLYRGVEQFSELPDQMNDLQDSYQQTVNELKQTKDELGQTIDELDETQNQLEAYRSENSLLQKQNQQLTVMIDELRDERAARESYIRRLKTTALTGLGLIAGYFVLVRLIRLFMRNRSRRGDRLL